MLEGLKARFRGRQAWRTINNVLFVGIYSLVLFGMMLIPPKIMLWVGIGLAIFLPSYVALFVNHLREMEKRDKGNKLILGWVTHNYQEGEPVYFTPTSFQRIDRLAPEDLDAIQEFIDISNESAEKAAVEVGFDRFKFKQLIPRQITQKEIIEKEAKTKKEMREIINEEFKEIKGFIKDFKEAMNKNNIEVESKDES